MTTAAPWGNEMLKKAAPHRLRKTQAGDVEQRLARGRSKAVAAENRRRAPTIRAWRAPDTDLAQAPKNRAERSAASVTRPVAHTSARAARMRAVEQAWKKERARQAELEATETR